MKDITPEIDFSLPNDEPAITAKTIKLAWLASNEDDPAVHELALMAITVVEQRNTERAIGRHALDMAARLTRQNRELQDRLRHALDENTRLRAAK
jgi:hypothetical protein